MATKLAKKSIGLRKREGDITLVQTCDNLAN